MSEEHPFSAFVENVWDSLVLHNSCIYNKMQNISKGPEASDLGVLNVFILKRFIQRFAVHPLLNIRILTHFCRNKLKK